jgi:phosphocarrier protein HPr
MISNDYTILKPEGIPTQKANALIKLRKQFKSKVSLKKDNSQIYVINNLSIVALGIKGGDTVTLIVEGKDEKMAAEAIDTFFKKQIAGIK